MTGLPRRRDGTEAVPRARVVLSNHDHLGDPHYGGGGARVLHELARRLGARHDVLVITSDHRGSGRRSVLDGVRYLHLPTRWAGPRGAQLVFAALLPLLGLLQRHDVWFESLTPPVGGSALPLVSRRVVGWAQQLPGRAARERYGLPFDRVERLLLRFYRRVIVLGEADAERVRAAAPRARVDVIPNGVDLPAAPAADLDAAARRDFLLYLGRIDVHGKGLDLLLDAHGRVPDALPLVIAGDGIPDELVRLRGLLPDSDRVRLVGRVDGHAKEELLSLCAGVIVPSRAEAFGLVPLEALAHGARVAAFAIPGFRWLAGSGAELVPPFDVAALARAVDRLSTTPPTAADAERGRTVALEHAWPAVADRYAAVVAQVAGARLTAGSARRPTAAPGAEAPRHA